ncbi:kinase/pyrophosphorylase [Irregularibacter muris]|uniref:Putative pyruvate, phosphate dikinase regulatory protein n=1 Tax=Irregularibacter muris TaxID=1796619 RepID=A0AAE3KYP2_9FIRM|nr:pyruvate, water dikinase regulatory protein [Irregularibacter muris]MCR1897870.1 kinase/pyrophosphorylase [Irregularibacter muris]
MEQKEYTTIYVVSDSLGETAELVAKAASVQFNSYVGEIKKFPFIIDEEQIDEIIEEAFKQKCVIAFTIVTPELRDYLVKTAERWDIPVVDIMSPLLAAMEKTTHKQPRGEAGLNRKLDEDYFKKVEAIEFAVKYDDGKDPRGVKKADVVLVGVSRTSKTPLSMYLANRNLKVANIPIVPEVEPPKELYEVPTKKLIGLTTDPLKLNQIRQERLRALGLDENANYANMERILSELDYAEAIMKKLGCPVIDVSSRAVEETAAIIFEIIRGGK